MIYALFFFAGATLGALAFGCLIAGVRADERDELARLRKQVGDNTIRLDDHRRNSA